PKVDVRSLPESFPDVAGAISRLRPQGVANLAVKISGDLQSLGFEAQADLTRAGWTIAEGLSKFIDTPCTLVVEGHRFPEAIVVSNAEVRYPPLLLVGNASFSPGTGAREYSASGRIASLAEFAKSRGEEFTKWSPDGRVVLSVKGRRATGASPDAYLLEADLAEVGITIPGRAMVVSGFSGHMSIAPESVEFSPLAGLINGQRFLLRGKIARGDAPAGELELQMGYLDLAALLPGEEAGGKKRRREEDALSARLAEEWNRELAFSAAVSIDAGDLWGVVFSRLAGKIRHEKGVLSFDRVRAALYGGEVVLSGALTGPGIDPGIKASVAMTNVESSEILQVKGTLGDFLSGKISLSADLAGSRKDLAAFLRTVTGNGSLRIVDGRMKGVDYPALAAAAATQGRSPRTAAPGDTPFREVESRFSLGGGKARLTDLRIDSGSTELVGDATIGLSDHTLELLGTLWLSKEASKAPPWSGGTFFATQTGETAVPLVVSGTLRSPAVAIDTTAAGRPPGRMLRGGLSGGGKR
ncbi:MAG TPA: AsmA-like C-terminal region-containing protein, partial [Candidatus Methylomirabilis sp.]|nr:AsmA-like C-terminal region-containing protein [Candidatus Methylomirabilis sp.]